MKYISGMMWYKGQI